MTTLTRCAPAECGVDAAGIARFIDAVEAEPGVEPHGLIIQRQGKRIAEGYWAPHGASDNRLLYSLSKSFTGTALGLQVGEGRLSLDDFVRDHLPECFDHAHPNLLDLKIRHIASMATGHADETLARARKIDPENLVRGFLQIPPDAAPGTLFAYNQPPVVALATILQRLAGTTLNDYLRPRLFEPLGIGKTAWRQLSPGIDLGYSGLYTNLDAVAKLGQLYLDDGMWEGTRVLPDGWVAMASTPQVSNAQRTEPDWQQGYGFQLWCSRHGYRGDGAQGQYMVVLPDQDAVIAFVSCTDNMQNVMNLMWAHLLPAMSDQKVQDTSTDAELQDRLLKLQQPTARMRLGGTRVEGFSQGSYEPSGDSAGSLKSHRTLTRITTGAEGVTLFEGETRIQLSPGDNWRKDRHMASSATRLNDGSIVIDLVMLETPHRLELRLLPEQSTFTSDWHTWPLFGSGLDNRLATMRQPD